MKTFKEYLSESDESKAGNYVALASPDLDLFWDMVGIRPPKSGSSPARGDYHCTLIYSKDTAYDPNDMLEKLSAVDCKYPILSGVTHFSVLGEPDASKVALVANLDSLTLHKLHDMCRGMGLQHSYPEFIPHITLRIDMNRDEANAYAEYLNSRPVPANGSHFNVELNRLKSERIK